MKKNRNNVTRLLDSRKIPYQVFELPPEKIGALETANLIGVSPESVYKTIVVNRNKPGKPILAVISSPTMLDLKALAKFVQEKKLALPTQREAEALTKLQSGGISPLALLNRGFQVVIDQSAKNHLEIHISGGERGLNIRLPVNDLAALTQARFAHISRPLHDKDYQDSHRST